MRRYCSLFVAVILLSACGNFIGTMGERIGGISDDPSNSKQGKQGSETK